MTSGDLERRDRLARQAGEAASGREAEFEAFRRSRGPAPSPLIASRLIELAGSSLGRFLAASESTSLADGLRVAAWRESIIGLHRQLCAEHQSGQEMDSGVLAALEGEWRLSGPDPCPPFRWRWFDKDSLWRALDVDWRVWRECDQARNLTGRIDELFETLADDCPPAGHRLELHEAMKERDGPAITRALLEGVRVSPAGVAYAVVLGAALQAWFTINESPRRIQNTPRASLVRALDGFLGGHAHELSEEIHNLSDKIRAGESFDDKEVSLLLLRAERVALASRAPQNMPVAPPADEDRPGDAPLVIQARRSDIKAAREVEKEEGRTPKKMDIRVRVGSKEGVITYQWLSLLQRLEVVRTITATGEGEQSALRRLKGFADKAEWGLGLESEGATWTCRPFALETYEPGVVEAEADRKARLERELKKPDFFR